MPVTVSVHPIRRLVHTSKSLGAFGIWTGTPSGQRELNNYEVNDFQVRNTDINALIKQFEYLVANYGYDQITGQTAYPALEWNSTLQIPPQGLIVADASYGNVLVAPDASGILHYDANVPAGVATQIQKPPYQSPPGGSLPSDFQAWLAGLQTTLGTAGTLVAVGVGGYLLVNILGLMKKR
jgi:hypothetical protein